MARIYLLTLLFAAQASLRTVKAMNEEGHRVFNPIGSAMGQTDDWQTYLNDPEDGKGDTSGAPGQPLPIPSDQSIANFGGLLTPISPFLIPQNWQLSEITDPPNPSQEKVEYHINRAILDNYPHLDPEIRAELQDETVNADYIMEWARICVRDAKIGILSYYGQQPITAIGQGNNNAITPFKPTIPDIQSAVNENFFIAFLYVGSKSKQLKLGHPYADKMFRNIKQEKLDYFLTKYSCFSSVHIIPMANHHFLMAMAIIEEVNRANFSNDPVRHLIGEQNMPKQNNLQLNQCDELE